MVLLLLLSSNHVEDWADGAEIGSREVDVTNIHKVDYGGHDRDAQGTRPPCLRSGYAPDSWFLTWVT